MQTRNWKDLAELVGNRCVSLICCGSNEAGQDTRAIQHYLGHRNITHTCKYTELASEKFNKFWQD